jgi:sugar transferase (PEP-CTERM/EpsH1 system associated)
MSEILYISHRIPFPPDRGDKIRSWHMLKHLGTLGRVHLACFADDEADAAHLPALRSAMGNALGDAHVELRKTSRVVAGARAVLEGKPVSLTMFDSEALRAFVKRTLVKRPVSTIFVYSGQMAQFVPERLPQRFVMDFGDVDSAKFADYAEKGGPLAAVHRREAEKLLAFERKTAKRADISLFVSDAEAALFRQLAGLSDADVRAVQNGVDLAFFHPKAAFERRVEEGPLLVFTGQMDYAPNIDAVTWFADEVLPKLPSGTRFAIVGRKPSSAVLALAKRPNIIVTGAVADVRTWLCAADIVVAPLRIARGIQNKVLEAMAMARPVVATPAAFEGIDAVADRDLVVANGAKAQAKAIAALLADPSSTARMGVAARSRMEAAYRWERRLAPLAEIIGVSAKRRAA